jgi:alkaline phosphatase D
MHNSIAFATLLFLTAWASAQDAARPVSRIAFGSCCHQDKPQPIWDTIVATKSDVFILLGDNIYADTTDMAVMRAKYAKLAAQPGFAKLRESATLLATWDDHDYGINDAGAEFAKRVESKEEFLHFLDEPENSPRRTHDGVYASYVFGPEHSRVQVILLDTRTFRGPLKRDAAAAAQNKVRYVPNPDESATMLGDAQWKWLEEQLRVPADVRIIGSSVQVLAAEHGFEKWSNLPHEQKRLYDLIRTTKAGGVVFISGDRHRGEISCDQSSGIGYPIYDVTSSSLNSPLKPEPDPNPLRCGEQYHDANFGVIEIDWDRAGGAGLRMAICDVSGKRVVEERVAVRDLQPNPIP